MIRRHDERLIPERMKLENYPEADFQTVNRDNYLDFVLATSEV